MAEPPRFFSIHDLFNKDSVDWATKLTWIVNWALLGVKIYCFVSSASKAIAAALADSIIDILTLIVLSLADMYINLHSEEYPVGRSRLEAVSVLGCAAIMCIASTQVIQCKPGPFLVYVYM